MAEKPKDAPKEITQTTATDLQLWQIRNSRLEQIIALEKEIHSIDVELLRRQIPKGEQAK